MNEQIEILIGADLVPTKANIELFRSGDTKTLFGEQLVNIMNSADIRVFNLETPLIKKSSPIKKCGPVLGIDDSVITGIKMINPTCLTMANNHIMDHGENGLDNTIKVLENNGINYLGVGENINKLSSYYIKVINNLKICFYACAEHEFSIATDFKPGATPFDPLTTYDEIINLSKKCDFLVVLYHGGKEFYPYPSPNLQKYCRKFIDKGADLVICQHSHCIGCQEDYNGKKIIYGQGNFIFDDGTNIPEWNYGFLIKLVIDGIHKIRNINFVVIERKENCIRIADRDKSDRIIKDFRKRSEDLKDDLFVKNKYKNFSNENLYILLRKFDLIGGCLPLRILDKITKNRIGNYYFKKIYLKNKSFGIQNSIECEAWNELLITAIKENNEERG